MPIVVGGLAVFGFYSLKGEYSAKKIIIDGIFIELFAIYF
jgi:hypothetical protein